MKKYSTLLDIREMQIKSTMGTTSYPVRWLLSKTKQTNKQTKHVSMRINKLEPLCIASDHVHWLQLLGKTVWWFLKKLNIELPYDPPIPLLGKYPEELKTEVQTDTSIPMFKVVLLFTTAKR